MKITNELRFARRAYDLWNAAGVDLPSPGQQLFAEGLCDMPASRQVVKAAVNKEQKRRAKLSALPPLDRTAAERAQLVQELQLDVVDALTQYVPAGRDIRDVLQARQAVAKMDALEPVGGPLLDAIEILGEGATQLRLIYAALFENPAADPVADTVRAFDAGQLEEPSRFPDNPNTDPAG